MSATTISLLLAAAYAAMLLIVALAASRRVSNSNADFFLAGRELGWITFALTMFATWMSTFAFLGSPGFYYARGVNWLMPHGFLVVASPFFLWFIGKKIWVLATRNDFLTPGDLFEHVYHSPSARLTSALICILALVPYCLIQLVGVGKVIDEVTGGAIPYELGVTLIAGTILFYSMVGGARAVTWTDVAQAMLFITILVGGTVAFVLSLHDAGQLNQAMTNIESGRTDFDPEQLGVPISLLVMWGFGYILTPHMWQRIYMTRSASNLARGVLAGSILAFAFIAIPSLLIGLLAHGAGIQVEDTDTLLVAVFQSHASWLMPLLLIGAVAAGMSTVDSQLLTASSIISHDLLGIRDSAKAGLAGKATVLVGTLVLLGLALSPLRDGAIVLLASKGIGIALLLLVPLLQGLFGHRLHRSAGTVLLVSGAAVLAALEFFPSLLSVPFGFGAPIVAVLSQAALWIAYRLASSRAKHKDFGS